MNRYYVNTECKLTRTVQQLVLSPFLSPTLLQIYSLQQTIKYSELEIYIQNMPTTALYIHPHTFIVQINQRKYIQYQPMQTFQNILIKHMKCLFHKEGLVAQTYCTSTTGQSNSTNRKINKKDLSIHIYTHHKEISFPQ
mgnify:CR=1 FL=1